jgi:ssDNA-binding Zn-finger/Zn-ribbon topoisomerase 1
MLEEADKQGSTIERLKKLQEQYLGVLRDDPHHVPQTEGYGPPLTREVIRGLLYQDVLDRFAPMHSMTVFDLPSEEKERWKKAMEDIQKMAKDANYIPIFPHKVNVEVVKNPADARVRQHPAVKALLEQEKEIERNYERASANKDHYQMDLWNERRMNIYRERQRVEAQVFQQVRAEMDEELARIYSEEAHDPPQPNRPACIRNKEEFNINFEECELCSHLQECSFHACGEPECPKCGCKMVLRQAKHGPMEDDWFWGCANFPDCRSTRTHNEVLGVFTGLHSIDIEESSKGYVGFEAYDEYQRELIYGRRFRVKNVTASVLETEFIEPCARAFNISQREVLEHLMIGLGVEWDDGLMMSKISGPDALNRGVLSAKLIKSPVLASIKGTKAHDESTLYRVVFECREIRGATNTYIELRAKSRSGQTMCGVKFTTLPHEDLTADQVRDCFLTPFVNQARAKTDLTSDEAILRKVADGLVDHHHSRARFVLDVVEDILRPHHSPFIHPAAVQAMESASEVGKAMAEGFNKISEGMDRYFKPKGTVTGRFPSKSFRDQVKNIPYPHERSMNEAFRYNYNAPPIQACASDVAALSIGELMDRSWSQQTEEFIKEQKRKAPRRAIERKERLHKMQEDERKLEKRTKLYEPTYCTHCHRTGCMCPRDEEVKGVETVHTCKDGKHVRLRRIPMPQQNDMNLPAGEFWYCLDCYEIVDENNTSHGKISTLADAP